MPQIALVSHQHNHNIRVRMIPQLFQPPLHILVRLVLADIIHQQCAHGTAVICAGDGAVAFLARRVPDLGFDGLGIDLDGAGCEFDADGGFGVKVEFVASESGEQVGFPDAGVSDKDNYDRAGVSIEVWGW